MRRDNITSTSQPSSPDQNVITEPMTTTRTTTEVSQYQQQKALDETKDNIRKSTDEARKEIPRYTRKEITRSKLSRLVEK